jgi:hypothetical protein
MTSNASLLSVFTDEHFCPLVSFVFNSLSPHRDSVQAQSEPDYYATVSRMSAVGRPRELLPHPVQGVYDTMSNSNNLKSPFIAEDAPSMADVLDKLDAATDLTNTQRRDLKSAIQSLCRILGKSPECVVANINRGRLCVDAIPTAL